MLTIYVSIKTMRTIRLFQILDILRSKTRPVSSIEIAETLGVTQRTIYRDMVTLESMGAPIRGEAGIGYQLESGYFLPPLNFNEDELDALVLGMRMLIARSDGDTKRAAVNVLGKLNALGGEASRHTDRPLLAVGSTNEKNSVSYIGVIRHAIRCRYFVSMEYNDLQDNKSTRTIRPLGLTAFESAWLLTAWCEKKDNFRNFRVDRIVALCELETTFRHQRGKRFSDYLKTLN